MKAVLRRDPELGYLKAETADAEDNADVASDLKVNVGLRRMRQRRKTRTWPAT